MFRYQPDSRPRGLTPWRDCTDMRAWVSLLERWSTGQVVTVKARIDGIIQGALRGWAWDSTQPDRRLVLAVYIDGEVAGTHLADRPRGDLLRAKVGDGAHGLDCPVPIERQDGETHLFELRLAETSDPAAEPLARARLEVPKQLHMLHGKLERLAGTQLIGWVRDRARPGEAVALELLVDGALAQTTQANRFRRDLLAAGIGHGSYGFVFDLAALPAMPAPGTKLTVRAGAAMAFWELGGLPFVETPATDLAAPAPAPPPRPAAPRALTARDRPRQAATLIEEARGAERRRDFAAAARQLDAALLIVPGDFEAVFLRARVAHALGDLDMAQRMATRALQLRPGHANPTRILARIASQAGRHAEAVALWAGIGPGDENYRERLLKRGRSLMGLGRPLEAMVEFGGAVALADTDRDALRGLAEACEASGGLQSALGHWRRLLELVPEDPAANERVAQILARARPVRRAGGPLRDATLRDWQGPLAGEVGRQALAPTPALRLRSRDAEGAPLRYAVLAPHEERPGELPAYALRLDAPAGGAELRFALEPEAQAALQHGLMLLQEGRAGSGEAPKVEILLAGAGVERRLALADFGARPRLLPFLLRLDTAEATVLALTGLDVVLRLLGAGEVTLRAPRLQAALPAAMAPSHGFEDPALDPSRFARLAG